MIQYILDTATRCDKCGCILPDEEPRHRFVIVNVRWVYCASCAVPVLDQLPDYTKQMRAAYRAAISQTAETE
jgi:hypothetical protein